MKIEIDGDVPSDVPKTEAIKPELGLFEKLIPTIKEIILNPSSFFTKNAEALVSKKTVMNALAFALLVDWIASVFGFFWRTIAGVMLEKHLADFFNIASDVFHASLPHGGSQPPAGFEAIKSKVIEFFLGAGGVILAPFMALFQILIVTALIHLAVKLFVAEQPQRNQSFATTMKIICYGMAPCILAIIPGIGLLASWIFMFTATVIGLRVVYQTTSTRAVIAVMFPQIVVLTLLMVSVIFVVFGIVFVMQMVS